MPKFAADWREVYRAEIRAIQAQYPLAHQALTNWGRWSRELRGIFPSISQPGWTDYYRPAEGDFAEEGTEPHPVSVETPVKAQREPEPHSDERLGIELDIRIHASHFPAIWRRVLRAAYVTIEIPEDQFPQVAKCGPQGYLMFLDGALAHLERAMG